LRHLGLLVFGIVLPERCCVGQDGPIHETARGGLGKHLLSAMLEVRKQPNKLRTYPPPMSDMILAPGLMISECASTSGKAKPVTTIKAVMKRPMSMGPEPSP
jgi:hypothetical protein